MNIRTSFEMEIDVSFLDEESSFKHFIESDWKESFYTFDNLDDVAEHISYAFHIANNEFQKIDGKYAFVKFIEGFGDFIQQDNGHYKLTEKFDGGGDITVNYEMELEPAGTFHIKKGG